MLQTLINNFSTYFKSTYNAAYTNQDSNSLQFLYDTCFKLKPDRVLDIGTNFGASTLSMAIALHKQGLSLDRLTTIDLNHEYWQLTPSIQANLIAKLNLPIKNIQSITSDFKYIDPTSLIQPDKTYMVFYDIHDTSEYSLSTRFLTTWLPLLSKTSFVGFHDISLVSSDYKLPASDPKYPRTMKKHYNGNLYAGFKECETIIECCNHSFREVQTALKTSILYFYV